MITFSGKVAIVTGASSGIGRATAVAMAENGASVAAVARDAAALEETIAECAHHGASAIAIATDLTSPDGANDIVQAAVSRFGGVDVVVNAAGIIATGATDATDDATWDRVMDLNVRAPFRLMRAAFPYLKERRGSVVNVSSVNGQRVFPNLAAYNTSKAALDQLTRCAALELAPRGVRVNSVNPGVVQTNLHREAGLDEAAYAAFLERSKTTHPLGRVGTPGEVAELITFLASTKAGWMTGANVSIDGGRADTCLR